MTKELLPVDCLIASDVFKDLSLKQDIARTRQRLNMQILNQRRLGRKQSVVFFKSILKTLKDNKLKGGGML